MGAEAAFLDWLDDDIQRGNVRPITAELMGRMDALCDRASDGYDGF